MQLPLNAEFWCNRTHWWWLLLLLFQGYLTENGVVDLARVQLILIELGDMEDEIFKKRREDEVTISSALLYPPPLSQSLVTQPRFMILKGQMFVSVLKLDYQRRDKERKKRQKMVCNLSNTFTKSFNLF